jgi:hypothetical protein
MNSWGMLQPKKPEEKHKNKKGQICPFFYGFLWYNECSVKSKIDFTFFTKSSQLIHICENSLLYNKSEVDGYD